jgi:hypothetical protein
VTRGPAPTVRVIVLGLVTFVSVWAFPQAENTAPPQGVQALYRQLHSAGLDPDQIYKIRDAVLDREDLHFYMNDGVIGFTKAVDGRITGAYFTGEGEILIRPPNNSERSSLGLFTGLGVLNERFGAAYLRFNDDTFKELQSYLRPVGDEKTTFLTDTTETIGRLAEMDGMRMLGSFTSHYPQDHFLHVRVVGVRLGPFDAFYDSMAEEQITVGKFTDKGDGTFYDVWMSFVARSTRNIKPSERIIDPWRSYEAVRVSQFKIKSRLIPPQRIEGEADLTLKTNHGGQRLLFFELSRFLKVQKVTLANKPLEFLQNESVDGTQLARRGNDLVALVLPEPLKDGQQFQLHFEYLGNVMEKAGEGLLYVGARGTWYPNRGISMSNYDLEFRWPTEWTLVATGKRVSLDTDGHELVGRWVSEVQMPLAGFNLGQYTRKSVRAGNVSVDAYASSSLESSLTNQSTEVVITRPKRELVPGADDAIVVAPPLTINPSESGASVADRCAKAIEAYTQWFGPYPYSSLAVTQFPARDSQGWPGLIFLSSAAWLPEQERARLKFDDYGRVVYGDLMPWHETGHMWWGDVVFWRSYRDQWLVEALSNYSALMMIEKEKPENFQISLDRYRSDLLSRTLTGRQYLEAGPVDLGLRLSSSEFPSGYVAISYGRGTWLLHMLRTMLDDPNSRTTSRDDIFLKALRTLRERFAFKEASTADLQKVFEEYLPQSLRFEGDRSLNWFFNGWVNGTAIPSLSLQDVKISNRGERTAATFTIVQKDAPEDLVTSVPIYGVFADGHRVFAGRVFADGNQTKARLSVPTGTKHLVLDPLHTILRRP